MNAVEWGFVTMYAYLHRMEFCVGWLPFRQFYGSDPKTPYISFVVIATLFDNFWRHPIGGPYESVLLRG